VSIFVVSSPVGDNIVWGALSFAGREGLHAVKCSERDAVDLLAE